MMKHKLQRMGFSEDEAELIGKFTDHALDAKMGDAFAQAKFSDWHQEDRETFAEMFREQGFEDTADRIENPVGKVYMALADFKEENFE